MVDIIIGIAGPSGSGKTTIAERIYTPLNDNAVLIKHDSYYKRHDEMTYEERCAINYDHPDSLDTDLLIKHIKALKKGETVEVPEYDFTNHNRKDTTTTVKPENVILVEGILIYTEPKLRELLDLKVFVDTDMDICLIRRIMRDVKERGRSLDSVINQYMNTVKPMYHEFIEPSKRYADVIIPEGGYNDIANSVIINKAQTIIRDRKKQEKQRTKELEKQDKGKKKKNKEKKKNEK